MALGRFGLMLLKNDNDNELTNADVANPLSGQWQKPGVVVFRVLLQCGGGFD